MRENIGLTPVEEQGLMNFVHGPNADGSTFLAQFETKSAPFSQLFTLTPGPMRANEASRPRQKTGSCA